MHWNVAPDALPGSAARLVRVLDCWPNDCIEYLQCKKLLFYVLNVHVLPGYPGFFLFQLAC